MRLFLLYFTLIMAFLLPTTAMSQDQHSWLVSKVTGTAFIAAKNMDAKKVRRGMSLQPGQTLSTRSKTRVLLIRGKERIQVGPRAIMAIPPAQYIEAGKTLILQQSGRLNLTVNKRDVKHFSVRTPFLVAVVKGTTFSVDVNEGGAQVSVSNGTVEVSDNESGETADIKRGQQASVAQINGKSKGLTLKAGTAAATKALKARKKTKTKTKAKFKAVRKVGGAVKTLQPGGLKVSKKQSKSVASAKPSRISRNVRMTPAQKRAAAKLAYAERMRKWALAIQRNPKLSAKQKQAALAKANKAAAEATEASENADTQAASISNNSSNSSSSSSNANSNSSSNSNSNSSSNNGNGNGNSNSNSSSNANSNSSSNNGNGNGNSNSNSSSNANSNSSSNNGNGNGNSNSNSSSNSNSNSSSNASSNSSSNANSNSSSNANSNSSSNNGNGNGNSGNNGNGNGNSSDDGDDDDD